MSQQKNPSAKIFEYWNRLHKLPFGTWLFSRLIGYIAPYSGTIKAHIVELEKGHAKVLLKERYRVRNHLSSIHAVALLNLGELSTGLSVISCFRPDIRAIVISLKAEYLKKARGVLTAEAYFNLPEQFEDNTEFEVKTEIKDSQNDVVAVVTAVWLIGYR